MVINRLFEELDTAITEGKHRSARMHRLEAGFRVVIAPRVAAISDTAGIVMRVVVDRYHRAAVAVSVVRGCPTVPPVIGPT